MQLQASQRRNFDGLNGLRGLAAIAVIGLHVPDRTLVSLLPASYLAVDFFFGLSGFVLAHAYRHRFASGLTRLEFIRQRVVRLYPLYFFGTLISLGYLATYLMTHHEFRVSGVNLAVSVACALFFVPTPTFASLNPIVAFPLLGPAWSLFWELLINIFFASFALLLSGRLLAWIIALGATMLTLYSFYAGTVDLGVRSDEFFGGGSRVLFSFPVGVAIHTLWTRRIVKCDIPWGVLPMALLASFMFQPNGELGLLYDLCMIFFLYPVIIILCANSIIGEWPRFICRKLGQVSYALYTLHSPLVVVFNVFLIKFLGRDFKSFGFQGTISFIIFMMLVAFLADRYYDRPVRRRLARLV